MPRFTHLAALFSLVATATAQSNWLWRPVSGPSPRLGHGMAFDSQRGVTVLVGGTSGGSGPVLNDTWEWDGNVWTQRFPAVSPPSTNNVVFDSQRGVTVLVHGSGTWEWDGTNWTQRSSVAVNPYGIAYDPVRGRTVALVTMGGSVTSPSTVMEWDGSSWSTIVSPTGPYFYIVGMAWSGWNQRVVAFAPFQGVSNPTAGARLWRWDGVTWSSDPPGVSTYVSGGALVSHGTGVVAYGGMSNSFPLVGLFTPPGTSTQVTTANPGGRVGHAMAYDSVRNRIVLFGGFFATQNLGSQLRGDTWEYAEWGMAATSASYGQGCGTPPLAFAAAPGSRPLLGSTFVADVANATPFATGVVWGQSGQSYFGSFANLPIDLAPWGMPGCPMWTSSEGLLGTTTVGSSTQFSLSVPNVPSLFGMQLYFQALSFRAGVNPLQFVVSNGLQITIGNL